MKVMLSILFSAIAWGNLFAQNGFAVVELFTSQGCSSCPAADKNLSDILASNQDQNIYGLSFHVDYWNYIGWKDPYSSKLFSARQRSYANALAANVYTPQMIVNGEEVFVGSGREKAKESISSALDESPKYNLKIVGKTIDGNFVNIQYQLDREPEGERLNVALVERDIENYVSKGENIGRTLHHDNVVRYFETQNLSASGNLKIDIAKVDRFKSAVVLYAQDKRWKVVAAEAILLSTLQ